METEGESLCCQDINEIPETYFTGTYFSISFLKLQDFRTKLILALFSILFSGYTCITKMEEFQLLCFPEVLLKNILSTPNDLEEIH